MFQYTVVASTLVLLFIPSFFVKKETVFQKITHSNGSEMRKKRTLCIGMMNRDRSWRREEMGERRLRVCRETKKKIHGRKMFLEWMSKNWFVAFFLFLFLRKGSVMFTIHIFLLFSSNWNGWGGDFRFEFWMCDLLVGLLSSILATFSLKLFPSWNWEFDSNFSVLHL